MFYLKHECGIIDQFFRGYRTKPSIGLNSTSFLRGTGLSPIDFLGSLWRNNSTNLHRRNKEFWSHMHADGATRIPFLQEAQSEITSMVLSTTRLGRKCTAPCSAPCCIARHGYSTKPSRTRTSPCGDAGELVAGWIVARRNTWAISRINQSVPDGQERSLANLGQRTVTR